MYEKLTERRFDSIDKEECTPLESYLQHQDHKVHRVLHQEGVFPHFVTNSSHIVKSVLFSTIRLELGNQGLLFTSWTTFLKELSEYRRSTYAVPFVAWDSYVVLRFIMLLCITVGIAYQDKSLVLASNVLGWYRKVLFALMFKGAVIVRFETPIQIDIRRLCLNRQTQEPTRVDLFMLLPYKLSRSVLHVVARRSIESLTHFFESLQAFLEATE